MSDYHVVPKNDIKEHALYEWCPCKPELRDGIMIHNAFDERERIETQLKEIGLSGGSWEAVKKE